MLLPPSISLGMDARLSAVFRHADIRRGAMSLWRIGVLLEISPSSRAAASASSAVSAGCIASCLAFEALRLVSLLLSSHRIFIGSPGLLCTAFPPAESESAF